MATRVFLAPRCSARKDFSRTRRDADRLGPGGAGVNPRGHNRPNPERPVCPSVCTPVCKGLSALPGIDSGDLAVLCAICDPGHNVRRKRHHDLCSARLARAGSHRGRIRPAPRHDRCGRGCGHPERLHFGQQHASAQPPDQRVRHRWRFGFPQKCFPRTASGCQPKPDETVAMPPGVLDLAVTLTVLTRPDRLGD
jgi:hypothetical protein